MRINEIVAITGMPGLYKVEGQKVNGLIVTSLSEGWTKFVSSRQYMFSLLENISIYTDTDNVELADVLMMVDEKKAEHPMPATNASSGELREWFLEILPNHDQEKVYTSDIKKLVKWFLLLEEKGVIEDEKKARLEEENVDQPEDDSDLGKDEEPTA